MNALSSPYPFPRSPAPHISDMSTKNEGFYFLDPQSLLFFHKDCLLSFQALFMGSFKVGKSGNCGNLKQELCLKSLCNTLVRVSSQHFNVVSNFMH